MCLDTRLDELHGVTLKLVEFRRLGERQARRLARAVGERVLGSLGRRALQVLASPGAAQAV